MIREAGLVPDLKRVMSGLDLRNAEGLALRAKRARDLFLRAKFPSNLEGEITKAYWKLCSRTGSGAMPVAVRSSPVGDQASEAAIGLHDSLLNVQGEYAVVEACRSCFASLFTGRAIAELAARRIDPLSSVLALGVQQMVRSDAGCSGRTTGFDPGSGFSDVIVVQGSYGVSGPSGTEGATQDEFFVHKPTLRKGFRSVVNRRLGTKEWKSVPAPDPDGPLVSVPVLKRDRGRYILGDDEVLELARAAMAVEAHLGRTAELSWAKDGDGISAGSGAQFLLQVRPLAPPSRAVEFTTYLTQVSLNRDVLVGIPGEAFAEFGLTIKEKGRAAGFAQVFKFGLTNGSIGYLLPRPSWLKHEYESLVSAAGIDLGPFVVENSIALMEKLARAP